MKAGTTSLYHYLREHPSVFMPLFKAPEFFAGEAHWNRGIEWYRRQFADAPPDAIAIGEASNVYTKYPRYRDVPKRIASYIPEARLIYLLRDPIARIRSHYQTRVAEGTEKAPFGEAVFSNPIYVDYSRYALQLEQYLTYFAREQLLIITSEDLRAGRHNVMRRAYQFLGVDENFVPLNLDRDFYRTNDKPVRSLVPVRIRKGLKRHFPATKRAKELEANVIRTFRRFRPGKGSSEQVSRLEITAETRSRLVSLLSDDVRRLRSFLGSDFEGWGIA
jgi:hypothetical protein